MGTVIEMNDKTTCFQREELEPILLKHGFKVGEVCNDEKVYYNKTPHTYIKYEYNFLKIFYKDELLKHSNFAFLKVFIFSTYLNANDSVFLERNMGYTTCFLNEVNSLSDLKDNIQKEIDMLEQGIRASVAISGEKAKIKKRTSTKEYYQRILKQIEDFVL